MAVVHGVEAILEAYHRAHLNLLIINKKRELPEAKERAVGRHTNDLEISLLRGKEVVKSQYEREYKKLGEVFAIGDRKLKEWYL